MKATIHSHMQQPKIAKEQQMINICDNPLTMSSKWSLFALVHIYKVKYNSVQPTKW